MFWWSCYGVHIMEIGNALNTNTLAQAKGVPHSAFKSEGSPVSGRPSDTLTLSDKAEQKSDSSEKRDQDKTTLQGAEQDRSPITDKGLSEAELLEVEQLKRRDAEVKAHEQAHTSAAGNLVQGGASFDYETGPDGKRYAVGGEVSIDTSTVAGDPQATLRKAQKIRRAASAPVDPSAQDRSVAAEASRIEARARAEITQQAREKQTEYIDENSPEIDFFAAQKDQNEKNIQDTYTKIQNASILQEQKSFVDFFI